MGIVTLQTRREVAAEAGLPIDEIALSDERVGAAIVTGQMLREITTEEEWDEILVSPLCCVLAFRGFVVMWSVHAGGWEHAAVPGQMQRENTAEEEWAEMLVSVPAWVCSRCTQSGVCRLLRAYDCAAEMASKAQLAYRTEHKAQYGALLC